MPALDPRTRRITRERLPAKSLGLQPPIEIAKADWSHRGERDVMANVKNAALELLPALKAQPFVESVTIAWPCEALTECTNTMAGARLLSQLTELRAVTPDPMLPQGTETVVMWVVGSSDRFQTLQNSGPLGEVYVLLPSPFAEVPSAKRVRSDMEADAIFAALERRGARLRANDRLATERYLGAIIDDNGG